jgi:YidC/Oxa1 family membrane protein insertase
MFHYRQKNIIRNKENMRQNNIIFILISIIIICIYNIGFINNNLVYAKLNNNVHNYNINNNNKEILLTVKHSNYKVVFTNKGAAIKAWSIKERNGHWLELLNINSKNFMANFENCFYKIIYSSSNKVCFEYNSPLGWRITKTYYLSSHNNMHNLVCSLDKINLSTQLPILEFNFDSSNLVNINNTTPDNTSKIFICNQVKPNNVSILKHSKVLIGSLYKWIALSNRYFVYAFIPKTPSNFDQIKILKNSKPLHYSVKLKSNNNILNKCSYSVNFLLGPKHYKHLKSYNLNLEKVINFGLFSFLGKPFFLTLILLHNLIGNYGWSIVLLTIMMQFLLLPLTLKSFKSLIVMKHLQPQIQNIQKQYANNTKRMQIEILNAYRTQKINPLGGCLPTLLQLPIFWAFFTILRNVYELRNEGWIFWIHDLSSPDKLLHIKNFYINFLPILMGIIMFLQQKMTATTSDISSYKNMMYIMPILFTIMFWSFPSGLIIYWIINSIFSLLEQYYLLKSI